MAEITRTYIRGLALPDPRLTFTGAYSSTLSTVSQAGPLPGTPEAAADTYATLVATGTQSAGGSLEVYAQRGGMPGLDAASVLWRSTGDARYRGWEPPTTVSGFDWALYTTTLSLRDPCVLRLADDGLVVVVENELTGQVVGRRRAATATSWTNETIYTHPGGAYASGARPCMVQLPSGRLLLFHCVEDATAATVNVGMRYSDDSGDTWSTGQLACLQSPISTATASVRRMRCAYLAGQIVLFMDVRDTSTAYYRRLAQYASADLGTSFALVAQLAGTSETTHAGWPDVATVGDALVLTYVRYATNATFGARVRPYAKRIGSAFALFTTAAEVELQNVSNPMAWGTYSAGDVTNGDMALVADDVGRVYAYGRDVSAAGYDAIAVRYSDDAGETWSGLGSSSHQTTKAMLWNTGTGTTSNPIHLSATFQRGRVVLAHQVDSVLLAREESIGVTFAGGWSAHQLPALTGLVSHDTLSAWERTWLPWDVPDAIGAGWTYAAVGTPTVTIGATGMSVAGAVGDSATWSVTPTGTMAQGVIAECWVRVANGTATFEVRVGQAGPDSFRASVRVTSTTITLYDEEAAAAVATISTTEATTGVWIRLAAGCAAVSGNNGRAAAYYAPGSRGDSEDREWVEIGTSSTLVQGADTTHRVQFRSSTAAVAIDQSWRFVGYTSGAYAGTNSLSGYTGNASPGDLLGRDLAASPFWVADGVRLQGTDGPAYRGDSWTVATAYRYPSRNVHVEEEPSPRKVWRSTTDAVEQILAWELSSSAAATSPALSAARVLYLGNINWRTGYLEARDDTGAWVSLATIDAASGQTGLGFSRYDEVVQPLPGVSPARSSIERYLTAGELEGARFVMSAGARVRKITRSTPGGWPSSPLAAFDGVRTRLVIEAQSGDPTSGTDGAVWMPNVTVVIHDTTGVRYNAYRLRIPAQTTAEGYLQVGVALLGYLSAWGQQYSDNRSQEIAPAYELTDARGGGRRVQQTGPARRAVEVSWDEGVDGSGLAIGYADYWRGHASASPLASPADVAPSMLGVLDQLGGAVTPCVYLPTLPVLSGATTTTTVVAPPLQLYGRIRSETLRMDTVQGNEYANPGEVYRVARVRIEEEL